jgi:hypothetical protein
LTVEPALKDTQLTSSTEMDATTPPTSPRGSASPRGTSERRLGGRKLSPPAAPSKTATKKAVALEPRGRIDQELRRLLAEYERLGGKPQVPKARRGTILFVTEHEAEMHRKAEMDALTNFRRIYYVARTFMESAGHDPADMDKLIADTEIQIRQQVPEEADEVTAQLTGISVSLYLDLDERDSLVVVAVAASILSEDDEYVETLWGPRGVALAGRNATEYPKLVTVEVRRPFPAESDRTSSSPLLYELPDFPLLLARKRVQKKGEEYRRFVLNSYAVRDGTPTTLEGGSVGAEGLYSTTSVQMLNAWLSLHDAAYLERAYGLVPVAQRPQVLTRLLTDDAAVLEELVRMTEVSSTSDYAESIYCYAPAEGSRVLNEAADVVPSLWKLSVHESFFRLYETTAQRIDDVRVDTFIREYVKFRDQGCTFFVDQKYPSREAAVRALFRLRYLTPSAREASRKGKELAGALPGALAGGGISTEPSEQSQFGRYARPKAPREYVRKSGVPRRSPRRGGYTREDAEERWREICSGGGSVDEARVDELRSIAAGLGVGEERTRGVGAKKLCSLISRQYEVEFGERARLREFAEESVPLAPRSPTPAETGREVDEGLEGAAEAGGVIESPRRKSPRSRGTPKSLKSRTRKLRSPPQP